MIKKVLVTGGAGFIGSHTVDYLLQQGLQVVVIDNLSSGNVNHLNLNDSKLTFINGDILDFSLLYHHVQQVDAVLHLAAIASVQATIEAPLKTFDVNLRGTLNVLEVVRQLAKPLPLVMASSAAVYADAKELPCSDRGNHLEAPRSSYALHKLNMEQYADIYANLYNVPSTLLRYFNVYGNRQSASSPYSGVISRFLHAANSNKTCTLFGDGHQSRDFIHIDDVVRANHLALVQKNFRHLKMNIATGQASTLKALVQIIEEVCGNKLLLQHAPERPGDIRHSYADVAKAAQELSFTATIRLKDGLKQMVRSII